MTKAEFITKVRENSELSKAQIDEVLTVILDTIVDSVAAGERVNFVGFGAFEKHKRTARTGVNPSTGKPIEIAEKNVPSFKAGKMFKDTVAESK
jgi:DNA-binding protein HU-beta